MPGTIEINGEIQVIAEEISNHYGYTFDEMTEDAKNFVWNMAQAVYRDKQEKFPVEGV